MGRSHIPLFIGLLLPVANVALSFVKPVTIVTDRLTILYENSDIFYTNRIEVHETGTPNSNVDVSMKLKEDLSNDVVVKILLLKENFGKYTAMGNTVEHNLCDFIKNDQLFYANLRKCGNFPDRCSFLKDTVYYAKRYKVLVTELPPVMPSGNWKIEFEIKNKTVQIEKGEWYGRIMQ